MLQDLSSIVLDAPVVKNLVFENLLLQPASKAKNQFYERFEASVSIVSSQNLTRI